MKKILALLLALTFCILPLLTACEKGGDQETEGAPGTQAPPPATETAAPPETDPVNIDTPVREGGFTYTVENNRAVIASYDGEGGDLVIPESLGGFPVSVIMPMTFAYNDKVTSVSIPGTVEATGELAFFRCTALTSVTLGAGVKEISDSSFNGCSALAVVNRPESLTAIGEAACQGCTALTAFDMTGLTSLGYRAFANSGLLSAEVPATLTYFGDAVFFGAQSLETAVIGAWNAEGNLPDNTFAYCYGLKSVSLPEGMKRTGTDSFFRCRSLETLTLPTTCFRLGERCLFGCMSLKTIYILTTGQFYVSYFAGQFVPALETIYYAGSEAQHADWSIESTNYYFTAATVVCDYAG